MISMYSENAVIEKGSCSKGHLLVQGVLIGTGVLINKTMFKGAAYQEGGVYWKEDAKNHWGNE